MLDWRTLLGLVSISGHCQHESNQQYHMVVILCLEERSPAKSDDHDIQLNKSFNTLVAGTVGLMAGQIDGLGSKMLCYHLSAPRCASSGFSLGSPEAHRFQPDGGHEG